MDAGSPEDAEAEEQELPVFKARVARGAWGAAVAPSEPTAEPVPAPEPEPESKSRPVPQELTRDGVSLRKAAPTKTLVDPDSVAAHGPWQELAAAATAGTGAKDTGSHVGFDEEFVPSMPIPGDITASGPLPALEGFDDLNSWIDRYPQDLGAHLALASAYTQAGDIDTALRIYRRMLRKSYVSDNVLRMVQDELADLEDLAHQYPRYHQVRGDLLVRRGQRTDAIDEYNKLG
jgi:pentatricopeptide repeat protein